MQPFAQREIRFAEYGSELHEGQTGTFKEGKSLAQKLLISEHAKWFKFSIRT